MDRLSDQDRDLLLSRYLDGELPPEQAQAVEEKIRTDAAWGREYRLLTESETRVIQVVETNWHDEEFTEKVRARVRAMPRPAPGPKQTAPTLRLPSVTPRRRRRSRRLWFWPLGLLLVAGAGYLGYAKWRGTRVPSLPVEAAASFAPAGVRVTASEGGPAVEPGTLRFGQTLSVEGKCARVVLFDGGTLWLGRNAGLTAALDGSLTLTAGPALAWLKGGAAASPAGRQHAHAAGSSTASSTASPAGPAVFRIGPEGEAGVSEGEAHFEVRTFAGGHRLRVLSGQLHYTGGTRQTTLVKGGQEITADGKVRGFDPREIGLAWAALVKDVTAAGAPLPGFAAPWSQLGGSPGHTGVTPCAGPAGLAPGRLIPFPPPPIPGEPDATPCAVVDAQDRAYVLLPASRDATQLYALDLSRPQPGWQPCGTPLPGRASSPAVITPDGLIVAGSSGRVVQAWNPATNQLAWKQNLGSAVNGLCALPDGLVLCSTFQRLVALNPAGEEAWVFSQFTDFQAPACQRTDGSLVAITRKGKWALLDARGHETAPSPGNAALEEARWPPVAGPERSVWLVTSSGALGKLGGDDEFVRLTLPATGWSTWPLGTGVLAAGNALHFPGGAKVTLPVEGQVVALAADAAGHVYAGLKDKVYVIQVDPDGSVEMPDAGPRFGTVAKGEIVRGGIAIAPGRLVVTTTEGVHLFE